MQLLCYRKQSLHAILIGSLHEAHQSAKWRLRRRTVDVCGRREESPRVRDCICCTGAVSGDSDNGSGLQGDAAALPFRAVHCNLLEVTVVSDNTGL